MKKNEVNNVNENPVENIVMDDETKKALIEDNLYLVPKNQRKKFDAMSLDHQFAKIQLYQEFAVMRETARMRNSIINKVRELFDKRHATIDDAQSVIMFCNEYIDGFKQRQIEEIDRQIAELEQLKENL